MDPGGYEMQESNAQNPKRLVTIDVESNYSSSKKLKRSVDVE